MNITYRQTQSGKWLVCEAKPHTFGVGVQKVSTPSGGHTTGYQYGKFDTVQEAIDFANELATRRGWSIVEWQEPVNRNPQFIDMDLPDDDLISINSDKTIEWYRGEVLRNLDLTPYPRFGYDLAIVDISTGERLLEPTNGRYRLGDLRQAIMQFREQVDARLGTPRGRNGGRDPIGDEPMKASTVRLPDELWQKAKEIGNGNASDGIRKALAAWRQHPPTN
jgi:hypothetical protein